jgi:hypothetical protein
MKDEYFVDSDPLITERVRRTHSLDMSGAGYINKVSNYVFYSMMHSSIIYLYFDSPPKAPCIPSTDNYFKASHISVKSHGNIAKFMAQH